jgi:nucleoside-diphosphate-sugar epimerase
MADTYLITGATGFLGGHLAEACRARGDAVVTIARTTSDTSLLDRLGVTVLRGDLGDPTLVQKALDGVTVVVHCAAKVGDWGPVDGYRAANVEALRTLLEACRGRALRRFVHMSSLGVYAFRHHHGTDESEPLPDRHVDGYTQTKVEAEQVALQFCRDAGVPVVVLRPGFIYGPRDRTVLPNLIHRLKAGKLPYIGGGQRAMNTIYVSNLVDAVFLAVERPEGVGQVYNLTDGEAISKKRFFDTMADALGCSRPRQNVPLVVAKIAARVLEWNARRIGKTEAPRLTVARVKFLGMNLDFSIAKAKRDLGYQPRIGFDEGMKKTMDWARQNAG